MPVIGTQQSPIQITHDETIPAKLAGALEFRYAKSLPGIFQKDNFVFTNTISPKTTQEITKGKELAVGLVKKTTWVLRKIHIHTPAEHLIDENPFADFECHLLHSLPGDLTAQNEKLVVGVLFTIDKKTPKGSQAASTLFQLNQMIRTSIGNDALKPCEIEHPHNIDVKDFLPDANRRKFYQYEGSLTSPPFTEDVNWYIMKEHTTVSQNNIDQILECAEQEQRPVQPLNRRYVLRSF